MGAADSVPGVSGGTMALIVGIYERLLEAIGTSFRAVVDLLRLRPSSSLARFRTIDWRFLLPLVVGIGTAILVAAQFIPTLLESHPAHMRGLFLGMVAASIAIPWQRIENVRPHHWVVVVVAAAAAFMFSGLPEGSTQDPSLVRIFVTAGIAICAMILPGVSGAFLLEVLGLYEPTLSAVRDMDVVYVAVFGCGAVAGLGSFSLLLSRLLDNYHDITMAALVGLMAGSLRALWPWQSEGRSLELATSLTAAAPVIGVAIAGFLFVVAIERLAASRSRQS